jgi:hypothetical protein
MTRSRRSGCRRPRLCRSRSWRWRWRWRNRRTRRWPDNNWAGHGRNLRRLRGWNDDRLWNNWGRRRHCGLCFDGARRRHGRAARLGSNRSGRRRNYWRWRRWGSYHGRLHASRSGGRVFRRLIRDCLLLGLYLGFSGGAKMLAHLHGSFYLDRAGMRFFLGNAGFGQIVDDGLCLDLELASQFVDSDLIRIGHCPPGRLLVSVLV